MRTIEVQIFKFNELNEKAKQNAISNLYNINIDHNWWEFIYEDAKYIGLKIMSFDLDRNRHAKGEFILNAPEVAQNILSNHGKECETYKTAESFLEVWQPIFNAYMDEESEKYESSESEDEMQELEDDFFNSLLEDYSIILQNACDYLQSDESIIDTIEANDYEFTEDGEMA